MTNLDSDIYLQIKNYQVECHKIDNILLNMDNQRDGILDFSYFKLKKQKKDIEEKIHRLMENLTPDIIA